MRLTADENWGKFTPVVSNPCWLMFVCVRNTPVARYLVPVSRPTPLTLETVIVVPVCVPP
jgi:hypothetical protein